MSYNLKGQVQFNTLSGLLDTLTELYQNKSYQPIIYISDSVLSNIPNLSNEYKIDILIKKSQAFNGLQLYKESEQNYELLLSFQELSDSVKANFSHDLALICYRQGNLQKALKTSIQARDLYKKSYGQEHSNYIKSLNMLGQLYKEQSKLKDAEECFLEAKRLNFKISSGKDMQYARIINNLADVYCTLQKYDKAENLYQTSLQIKRSLGSEKSLDYAKTLFNLAKFYLSLDKYQASLKQVELGLQTFSEADKSNSDYLKFQDLKAILLHKLKKFQEAELIMGQLIQIREETGLTKKPEFPLCLMNLATLYLETKRPDQTILLAERAIPIFTSISGYNHSSHASMLTTLADAQTLMGDYQKADDNYDLAAGMLQRIVGGEHIDYFHTRFHQARMLRLSGKIQKAKQLYKSIDHIPKKYIRKVSNYLSERELENLTETYREYHEELYGFTRQYPSDADLCGLSYDNVLFYKGYVLSNLHRMRSSLHIVGSIQDLREHLIDRNQQLETLHKSEVKDEKRIADLEIEIEELEVKLKSELASIHRSETEASWEEIRANLLSTEVALEILEFQQNDSLFYAALLIRSDSDHPIFIDLCPEWMLRELTLPKNNLWPAYLSRLYNYQRRGELETQGKKISLYQLIWQPIANVLGEAKTVYYSPAGYLHRISLGAIPTDLTNVIMDEYEIRVTLSTKTLLGREEYQNLIQSQKAILVGGIRYNLEDKKPKREIPQWPYLPWTESEVLNVQKICKEQSIQTKLLQKDEVSEASLRLKLEEKPSFWRFVHLSTHGYFNNGLDSNEIASRGSAYKSGLIGSGLVLSGANDLLNSDQTEKDGIWTSLEISQTDLTGTELVTLSACETGLGELRIHEGVYGLQRAFKIAGARYIIMSLWQVPDRETHEFMVLFYNYWLGKGMDIRMAFKNAQLDVKDRFINPEQWGGFVLIE